MTIGAASQIRASFACDGASTVFPVPIQAYQAADFKVILTAPASAGGGQLTLLLNSDYSMVASSTDAPPKWTLTTLGVTPYAVGYTLQIIINDVVDQETQYVEGQAFPSLAVQTNFDRLTQMVQRLQDQYNRSIHAPDGDVAPNMLLPLPAVRASTNLGFDPNGNIATFLQLLTGTLSQASIGAFLYPPTPGEIAVAAVIVQGWIPPGIADRYGVNAVPGTTDMGAAINTCIAANQVSYLLAAQYGTTVTISVPSGKSLFGAGMISAIGNPPGTDVGSAIIALNLNLTPVVQAGSNVLKGGALKGFSVFRVAGVPAAGTWGILQSGGQNPVWEDLYSNGHQIPLYVRGFAPSGGGQGIALFANRVQTGGAYDVDLAIDTMPEVRFNQCRIGSNSFGDVAHTAYVAIQGGNGAHPTAGPNSVIFENCQFNSGAGSPQYWLYFRNMNAPGLPTIDARVFEFNNCHIEGLTVAALAADASWASVDRIGITNSTFNTPTIPFFALPAACVINAMRIAANWIAFSTFAPGVNTINSMTVTGNCMSTGAVTYNAVTGNWQLASVGNTYENGASCTASGDKWDKSILFDTYRTGSTFTNNIAASALANVTVLNPGNAIALWTPVLQFGGAAVGMTYTTQSGACQVNGNQVTYQWRVKLSAKGSSVGNAAITGFPITHNAGLFQSGGGGLCFGLSGMAGLTMPILAVGPIGAPPGAINLQSQAAAGTAPLTDANFTNASDFAGSVTFFL